MQSLENFVVRVLGARHNCGLDESNCYHKQEEDLCCQNCVGVGDVGRYFCGVGYQEGLPKESDEEEAV